MLVCVVSVMIDDVQQAVDSEWLAQQQQQTHNASRYYDLSEVSHDVMLFMSCTNSFFAISTNMKKILTTHCFVTSYAAPHRLTSITAACFDVRSTSIWTRWQ